MAPKVATTTKRKTPVKKVDAEKVENAPKRALRSPGTRTRINDAAKEKDAFHNVFNNDSDDALVKITKPRKKIVKPTTKRDKKTPGKDTSVAPTKKSYKGQLDAKYLPKWFGSENWSFAPRREAAVRYKEDGQWDGDWKKLLLYNFSAREIAYITEDPDFINFRYGGQGYSDLYKNWPFKEWPSLEDGPTIRHIREKEAEYDGVGEESRRNDEHKRRREIQDLQGRSVGRFML